MIQSLQSLRGVFVVLIFLRHFRIDGTPIFSPGGDLGVVFFFILSGFVLRKRYARCDISYLKFLRKRVSKIYPLHIVCLATAAILYWSGLLSFVLNLFLLQSWEPDMEIYFSYNGVSWYLSTLMLSYISFPLLNKCIDKHSVLFYAIFIVITVCYIPLQALIPDNVTNFWIYVFPPSRLIDFIIGMGICDLINSIRTPTNYLKNFSVWAALTVLILAIVYESDIRSCYLLAAWWWLPITLLIATLAVSVNEKNFINRLLSLKPFVWLGEISFSFYLTHALVMRIVDKLDYKFAIGLNGYAELCIVFVATIVTSVIAKKLIVKSAIT